MRVSILYLVLACTPLLAAGTGDDSREVFAVTGHVGIAIDTFAGPAYRAVVDAASPPQRVIGGIDAAYRMAPHLWLYLNTLHGVRSAESADIQLGTVLRNATTLEAVLGLRYEFLALNAGTAHPARLYVGAQLGLVTIAPSAGDVFDVHHLAVGAMMTAGPYTGSYVEINHGRNDLFIVNRYRRTQFDAYLQWSSTAFQSRGVTPYIRLLLDTDLAPGPDSAQTSLGIKFNLEKLFGN